MRASPWKYFDVNATGEFGGGQFLKRDAVFSGAAIEFVCEYGSAICDSPSNKPIILHPEKTGYDFSGSHAEFRFFQKDLQHWNHTQVST
jgi:hypothetical protein